MGQAMMCTGQQMWSWCVKMQVKALEAAEAARRKDAGRAAERMKQRDNLEQQKADRARHAQEVKVMGPRYPLCQGHSTCPLCLVHEPILQLHE